jgi:aminoglycoside phosphotransferase family enzyme/predicted kinase
MTQIDDPTNRDVLAFLSRPGWANGAAVTRIDTHAAAVFLAGDRALKVKRAVRFPFLDFSTHARRKAACEAEIEANRPFAPQLYRGVVAITREADGRLAVAGNGVPVEFAVAMTRFDETRTLDRLAEAGPLDAELSNALGHAVAAAHARTPAVDGICWIEQLSRYILGNDEAFRALPDLFDTAEVARLTAACAAHLARIQPLLQRRAQNGLIRRGHGDLHLGNIALIAGTPVPFDALEFDPLIAAGDLLYDLAFLLMDLVDRNQPAAANRVFNRYLSETRRDSDLDALAALPLFIALRAAIRAKVTAARLEQVAEVERHNLRRIAASYFTLACAAVAPPPARLVAIGGLSGTGKSRLAQTLAPTLGPLPGAVVLRSDVERKGLFGIAENSRLPAEGYAADVTARVYARVIDKARHTAAAGHAAIVDAVFAQAHERAAVEESARAAGVAFHGVWLETDLATRLARIGGRHNDASDADATVARQQEHYSQQGMTWTRIDAGGALEDTLALIETALARA